MHTRGRVVCQGVSLLTLVGALHSFSHSKCSTISTFLPHFSFFQDSQLQDGIQLLVWHTLLGYWGGVSPNRGYASTSKRPWWPSGLRHVCPNEVDVWEGDFSVLEEQDTDRAICRSFVPLLSGLLQSSACYFIRSNFSVF